MPSILKLENVSYSYDGNTAVEDISLEVNRGDYLGIIGPNGSGKTTLLRLMLGLLKPKTGNVYLFGQPIGEFSSWTKIGYVPQKATQFEASFPITVEEVVSLGRLASKGLFGKLNQTDRHFADEAMAKVSISPLRKKLISRLSGGQQQRVFIAKALASEPDLLILDEPTVGIDIESQNTFYDLLCSLNQKDGKTIVIVSHDVDVIAKEVTTIAHINTHLLYYGTPKEFMKGNFLKDFQGNQGKLIVHDH